MTHMQILEQSLLDSFDDNDTRHGMVATGGLVTIPEVDSRKERDDSITRETSDIVNVPGRQPKSVSPGKDYKVN